MTDRSAALPPPSPAAQSAGTGAGAGPGASLPAQANGSRPAPITGRARPLRIAIVAGEHSGDQLGAALIGSLQARQAAGDLPPLEFSGVGGARMAEAGMPSLFPLEDVAVMGPVAIAAQLPKIVRRVYQTVEHIVERAPDLLVIVDSPEFTHPIAKRVRRKIPDLPVIDYVSPSVWAWRPGRARKMAAYVDHVLALLPFEPKAHAELGGPRCTYVGHPMIERLDAMRTVETETLRAQLQLRAHKPILALLPGSRTSEVRRLLPPFMETVDRLLDTGLDFETVIPALPHVRPLIDRELTRWGMPVYVVEGDEAKLQTFKLATAALAASGTVSLELALIGTPMVIAYRVDAVAAQLRHLVKAHSIVLPNLILGENAIPEYIQEACRPETLVGAVGPLLRREAAYEQQSHALDKVVERMQLADGQAPSAAAADVVAKYLREVRPALAR
ncbi:MAG: lipid-A-disaccharide synthase [Pseudomonadota bacterium]